MFVCLFAVFQKEEKKKEEVCEDHGAEEKGRGGGVNVCWQEQSR